LAKENRGGKKERERDKYKWKHEPRKKGRTKRNLKSGAYT
jgi:hypothetical protein